MMVASGSGGVANSPMSVSESDVVSVTGIRSAGRTELAEISVMSGPGGHAWIGWSNRGCANADVPQPPAGYRPARPPHAGLPGVFRGRTRGTDTSWWPTIPSNDEQSTRHLDALPSRSNYSWWVGGSAALGDSFAPCHPQFCVLSYRLC